MFDRPDKGWRRLTEHYAGMYQEELLELARDYDNLTEMAQQALRDEMKKRDLGDPTAPRPKTPSAPPAEMLRRSARPVQPPPQPAPPDPRREEDRMRFAERYAGLIDDDLLDLADDMESLTQGAQLALAKELERRGLGESRAISESQEEDEESALARAEAGISAARNLDGGESETDLAGEYTWKVQLSEYPTRAEALQRMEMLRRAGIESWFRDPSAYFAEPQVEMLGYRVMVAADQLEEAQRILANPVPADIVEQSRTPVPEYEMPTCPRCRLADPVLIDTEPSNKWLCESCGHEWTDPVPADTPP